MKAFPWHEGFEKEAGMDLRDYFAGQIIPSLIINQVIHSTLLDMSEEMKQPEEDVIAGFAYAIADAMMEVRNGKR